MKYALFIPICLTIIACAGGQKSVNSEDTITSVNQELRQEITAKTHKDESLLHKPQRKWLFNGEEFVVQGRAVVTGANIFNLNMQQYGVIQEHMFVTLRPEVDKSWLNNYLENEEVKITAKIGASIYRLTFKPATEIFTLYQRLSKTKQVKSVEISVFYSASERDVM